MKTGNRSNALLVELLIVVLFFMLAATVLLQVFTGASDQGNRAGKTTQALNAAQNVAERLYMAGDAEAVLRDMQFTQEGEVWTRDDGDFVLEAVTARETRTGGVWRGQEVRVTLNGDRLVTLPCSRYEEGAL